MKVWVKILLLAAMAGLAALWLSPTPGPEDARVGSPAPGFALPALYGTDLRLDSLRGQVVVLNFWAPWCQPCKEEMPALVATWNAAKPGCLAIVGVTEESTREDAAAEAQRSGLPYPLVLDADGAVGRAYGLTAYPRTYVIDASGVVRKVLSGKVTQESLEKAVAPFLPDECRRAG